MKNLAALQNFVETRGWYIKSITLTITLEASFEGFYGLATEDWESQVVFNLHSPDETICPNVRVVGVKGDGIEDVAAKVMGAVTDWKMANKKP